MKRVHIIHDPYKLDESTVADVENPLEYLKSEFKDGFPEHAKIYKGSIAVENDITEKLQKDELLINLIDEDIWVVIFPSDLGIGAIIAIVSAVISAVVSIYMYLTMPQPETAVAKSPNNELSNRVNQLRLNGRVPEIFGTLRSTPDLISAPILYYRDDGIEIEDCLYCVTKGHVNVLDIKDGDTFGATIPEFQAAVYEPNSSILDAPQIEVGDAFTDLPMIGRKSEAVTGQSLDDPTESVIDSVSSGTAYPQYPNRIYFPAGGLNSAFSVGEAVIVDAETFGIADTPIAGSTNVETSGIITIGTSQNINNPNDFKKIRIDTLLVEDATNGILDLAGLYDVSLITKSGSYAYEITLVNPSSVNPNWTLLTADNLANSSCELTSNIKSVNISGEYPDIAEVYSDYLVLNIPASLQPEWDKLSGVIVNNLNIELSKYTENWLGWFYLNQENIERLIFNIYFPKGVFGVRSDGKNAVGEANYDIEYQEVLNGSPVGDIYLLSEETIAQETVAFGKSNIVDMPSVFLEGVRFRIRKTNFNTSNRAAVYDEIKVKSVYACGFAPAVIGNDVTFARSRTVATDGALAVKERRFNMLVQRKLPLNGTGPLTTTNSAAQALIYLALDQKNGRRSINEVDIAQILAEEQMVINYFSNPQAAEFSYTLDDNNLSFEEIAGMVASSMFCEAYRYGNKLRVRFEQPQQNSVLLFNAANKAPNNEKRTKAFASRPGFYGDGYDGIEIEYTSPDDDTRITYVASDSENPINTMQIKTSGIRSHEQAKTRAWREWNKLKYRNITCEFEALEESELLARNDRVLVADNTVIKTKDGIIDYIDGLTLGLSHPIDSGVHYFIYLQLADGRVDIVPCSYVDEYTVLLSRPPLIALVPEFTTYQLIESTEAPHNAFMVTEIRPQGKMTNMLTCVNYDERYYQNDADFF